MKLIDGIKQLTGSPANIPDNSREELPEFFKELGFKTGAEIGVHKGAFTEKFCKAGFKMFAIDPWKAYSGAGRSQQAQERQDFLYGHTQRTLAPYKDCTIIRKSSMDALNDFKDGSLDFVYLDGDHSFPFIAQDIYYWYKKVRKGGVLAGHDYFCTDPGANNVISHVSHVVDAFVKTFQIKSFFTFGHPQSKSNDPRNDKTLSWMIIKN